jgi:transcriptional regulator
MANPVPFLIDEERRLLQAHIARANPQGAEIAAVTECLVVFQGPDAYVTPSWYATKRETGKVVPTWNYVTVHVTGRPRLVDDAGWIARQIDALTRQHEGARPEPWHVGDAPAPFVAAQIKGIVGVEIDILRSEGKWKVSQNRPAADRAGVVAGLSAEGERAMAALVAERR